MQAQYREDELFLKKQVKYLAGWPPCRPRRPGLGWFVFFFGIKL